MAPAAKATCDEHHILQQHPDLEVVIMTLIMLHATAVDPADCVSRYTMKDGDTFWQLSINRGLSLEAVLAANPGVVPEHLQIGQRVNLPCRATWSCNCTDSSGSPVPDLRSTLPSPSPAPNASGVECA